MWPKKWCKWELPCFYCNADSTELKFFLICFIGALSVASLLLAIGFYLKGVFNNAEAMADWPLRQDGNNHHE